MAAPGTHTSKAAQKDFFIKTIYISYVLFSINCLCMCNVSTNSFSKSIMGKEIKENVSIFSEQPSCKRHFLPLFGFEP